ncbi:WD40-repeat-containing domain protein, partial [Blyttiomyces helicus]
VTGGRDKAIHVWSVADDSHVGNFKQHRDLVSSVTFRKGENQLYSASFDRTVKLWNVDELSYIETLFGHQDQISSIDTITRERCVTAGSRDRTLRMWKIIDESQLIFRAGGGATADDLVAMEKLKKPEKQAPLAGGSLECVAMIDEDYFLSGSDVGKKPIFTRLRAHGTGSPAADAPEGEPSHCAGITALATVRYSDLFVSGSADGHVRLWKVAENLKTFALLTTIEIPGFINSLIFFEAPALPTEAAPSSSEPAADTPAAKPTSRAEVIRAKARATAAAAAAAASNTLYLAVGVGQEHRMGRWWKMKGVKNEVRVITLG